MKVTVNEVSDRAAWDAEVNALGGHPMQLWGWGEVKATGSWTVKRLRITRDDGVADDYLHYVGATDTGKLVGLAQVLVRSLPVPFISLSHIPRGPVIAPVGDPSRKGWGIGPGVGDDDTRESVTSAVVDWVKDHLGGVGIIIEPDWPKGTRIVIPDELPSPNPILYPHTLILDLTRPLDKLLKEAGKTTRYDIRKAERDGLDIRRVVTEDEVRAVLGVYHETAERAGFGLHKDDYYLAIQREMGEASHLIAAFDPSGEPCSFVWSIASATTSFELYGGVNDVGRKFRANAPVKWHAIKLAHGLGLVRYDLNGLLNDGITEFKRSFAKHENELIGSIDVPYSPLYGVWNRGLPAVKQILRRLANS